MRKAKRARLLALFLGALLPVSVAQADAREEEPLVAELVHSDLPIFGDETQEKWPRPFSYEADEKSDIITIGCNSRVRFGDWALRGSQDEANEDPVWYSFRNYGIFHCWAVVGMAYERAELPQADSKPSFFVFLGRAGRGGSGVELWAIQMGGRPGSDYLLLSRPAGEEVINSFSVLQRDCPKGNLRDAGQIDILLTRYCAINSKSELLSLARRMAERKPLGTLTFVSEPAEPADD